MSTIAVDVSSVSTSGSTCRNRWPLASNVLTPSVVSSRYGVSSPVTGSRSEYANSVTHQPYSTGLLASPGRVGRGRCRIGERRRERRRIAGRDGDGRGHDRGSHAPWRVGDRELGAHEHELHPGRDPDGPG